MQDYVLGFMFSDDGQWVALIKKTKPQWQAGLLNGIGGKVEPGEESLDAMVREFKEETGVQTHIDDWDYFLTMSGEDWRVYCYRSFGDEVFEVATQEEEEVKLINMNELSEWKTISNLQWLLPMALDDLTYGVEN